MEGGHGGGGYVPLGTPCAVSRGEVGEYGWVGLVGVWGHEHGVSSRRGCGCGNGARGVER